MVVWYETLVPGGDKGEMNRATRQKLSALRALVDHPGTPEHERENAEVRIREIEERVKKEKAVGQRRAMPTSMAKMAERISRQGLARFKNRVRGTDLESMMPEPEFYEDWPFGWTGPREKLKEVEMGDGFRGERIIGWKCPDCGGHVTRIVTGKKLIQFMGNPRGLRDYIERIVSAETNHLCVDCWKKWDKQ